MKKDETDSVAKHRDEHSEHNSSKYHTGKICITKHCICPAGTAWSPHWCWFHNAERLDRVTSSLEKINKTIEQKPRNL